jgi:hypothetical protein
MSLLFEAAPALAPEARPNTLFFFSLRNIAQVLGKLVEPVS